MTHKLIKTDNYLLVVGNNYKSDRFPYTVAERLTTGKFQLWQVDNPNDWDEPNQYKILAHLPLNGSPILEGVDLLPPIEDDIERLAEIFRNNLGDNESESIALSFGYKKGYNKAREKYKYTEEDVIHLLHKTARKYFQEGREYKGNMAIAADPLHGVRRELINMVQSLHQYPTEFESEMVGVIEHKDGLVSNQYEIPKTITTAQGVQWVGKYK